MEKDDWPQNEIFAIPGSLKLIKIKIIKFKDQVQSKELGYMMQILWADKHNILIKQTFVWQKPTKTIYSFTIKCTEADQIYKFYCQ